MHPQVSQIFSSEDCPGGICVVDGYGLRVAVERKHLVIADGIGRARRTRRFARADRSIRRIVVLGNSGTISLDALRFLGDIKVPLAHIDGEGRVLAVSAVEGTDNPALRRAQALAADLPVGLEIARSLIDEKLRGQLKVTRKLEARDSVSVIELALDDLAEASKPDEILHAEAVAASVYWQTWWEVPVRFVKADLRQVPAHWLTFGQRRSPLSQSARSAVAPANAILNYLYALLVAEARIACLTMGLDPGVGILHADKANRDSLVADVMEPVRPQVDAWLLDLLDRKTFRASDFAETRQGVCRVLAPLSHELAESATLWAQLVGPVVERVADQLAKASQGVRRVSTPITGRSRSAAARRVLQEAQKPARRPRAPRPGSTCRTCGEPVSRPDYRYCDTCRPEAQEEAAAGLVAASRRARQARRAQGVPESSASPEARAKLGSAIGKRDDEATAWDAAHAGVVVDRETFAPIAARLPAVTLGRTTAATGLSKSYAASVRRGFHVPHPRHWAALAELTGVPCPFEIEAGAGLDLAWWRGVVVPALASVTTTAVAEATGLSAGQASKVRRGLHAPDPKHWSTLAALAGVEVPR